MQMVDEPMPGSQQQNGQAPPSRRTVMIVDDDREICATVADALQDEGYRVTAVYNGADALSRIRSGERPALILLDLMMPVMDGQAFRREQRNDPRLADIPVVPFTAHATAVDVLAMETPVYLAKPVRLDELVATVRRFAVPNEGAPMHGRIEPYKLPILILIAAVIGWILLQAALARHGGYPRDERRPISVRGAAGGARAARPGYRRDGQGPVVGVSVGAGRARGDWGTRVV